MDFDYLNVSGMRFNPSRTQLHKNMSITPEERAALERLIEAGVEVWMQPTCRDPKVLVSELLAAHPA